MIREDVAIYEAQQRSLDSDPEGATPENVNERVRIRFDQGLLQAREIIARMSKDEAAVRKGATGSGKAGRKAARPAPRGAAA